MGPNNIETYLWLSAMDGVLKLKETGNRLDNEYFGASPMKSCSLCRLWLIFLKEKSLLHIACIFFKG